jgi:glyoxylase-like metal-dependent hydrolase (beta-lactamase superfamily II)
MNRFIALLCLTTALIAHTTAHAVEVTFQPVADGVFAYIGETDGRSYANEGLNANLGLVVTPAGAVLIDSGASFQSAQKIHAAIQKVTTQPLKWVINTGGQDHRWLGNSYFKTLGIEIIAHASAQADMLARGQQHIVNLQLLNERLSGTTPTLPTRFVNGGDVRLELGGLVFELKYRGGGHTPGDMMVWLPHQNIMFSGDVVYVDRVLGLAPVSKTKTWLDSFAVIDQIKPNIIVPGHGQVTTLATAQQQTRDLLIALRAHTKREVDGSGDMNAAIKSFDAKPFAQLKHASTWIPQLLNLTYLEVERE